MELRYISDDKNRNGQPNPDTLKAMEDAKNGKHKNFKNAKELITYDKNRDSQQFILNP